MHRALAAAAAVVACGGCSFRLARPPADGAPPSESFPKCTTDALTPSLDGLVALGALGVGVTGVADGSHTGLGVGISALAVAVVEAVASSYGAVTVAACRRAHGKTVHLLLSQAASAARARDCTFVTDVAMQLAEHAPNSYLLMVHDPTFAACF